MARGNNDIITVLVDTKNSIGSSIDVLEGRLDTAHQHLGQQFTDAVSLIRQDHGETRDRVGTASSQVTQAAVEIAGLKREINGLRRTVEELADLVRKAALPGPAHEHEPPAVTPTPTSPGTDPALSIDGTSPSSAAAPGPQADGHDTVSPVPGQPDSRNAEQAGQRTEDEDLPRTESPNPASTDAADTAPASVSTREEPDERETAEQQEQSAASRPNEKTSRGALLLHAAGIGHINLVCSRDAWEFIAERASGQEHFRATIAVADESNGLVRVTLSGRSLIGVLIALSDVALKDSGGLDGSWALAHRFYGRIAEDMFSARREGTTPLTIVFNDGVTGDGTPPQN